MPVTFSRAPPVAAPSADGERDFGGEGRRVTRRRALPTFTPGEVGLDAALGRVALLVRRPLTEVVALGVVVVDADALERDRALPGGEAGLLVVGHLAADGRADGVDALAELRVEDGGEGVVAGVGVHLEAPRPRDGGSCEGEDGGQRGRAAKESRFMPRLTPVKPNHYIRRLDAPSGTCPDARRATMMAPTFGCRSTPQTTAKPTRGLLVRLRAGDRAAFAALVQRNAGSLLRVARSLVAGSGDGRGAGPGDLARRAHWASTASRGGRRSGPGSSGFCVNKARTRFARDGRTVPFSALGGPSDGERSGGWTPERFDADDAWRDPPSTWTEEDPERLAMGAETRAAIEAAIAELPGDATGGTDAPGRRGAGSERDM